MSFVVVSFCMDARALEDALASANLPDPGAFPHRAVRVGKQAEALGGKLCAFGPRTISFAFQSGDIEEAVALAARVVTREEPRWMAGLSEGHLIAIQEVSSFSQLSWGRPLAISVALAESAHPGEVLADPEMLSIVDVVRSDGSRWVSGGVQAVSAVSIDVRQPLLRDAVDPFNDEPAEEISQSGAYVALEAAQAADLARQALIRGDIEMLDLALAQLKPTGAHPALVERLAGLLALNRGAMHEGLRTLRQAAESESRPAVKTRARLAYAIAMASAARPETALLEALTALSLARASEDRPGEQASARFLAQLSFTTGHPEAARAWEHVAGLAGAPDIEATPLSIAPDPEHRAATFAHDDEAPLSSELEPEEAPRSIEPDDDSLAPPLLTDEPFDVDATYVPDGNRDPSTT